MPPVAVSDDQITRALEESGGNKAAAARALGMSVNTLKDRVNRSGLQTGTGPACQPVKATTEVRGDTATFVTPPAPDLGDLDALMRERGLDPTDWEVVTAKLNEWDAMTSDKATGGNGVVKMRQLTVTLRKRVDLTWLFPAVDVALRPAPKPRKRADGPLTAFLPDPHCPFNDPELDKRLREALADKQPDHIVCLGDVCDFSSISRHRDNPAWMAQVQENVQAGFEWWARLRDACPNARMSFIEGNHDARIRTELLTRAERMYGIKPAEIPGEGPQHDALSLRHLLHLDKLHVEFVGPPLEGDSYFHGHLNLAPNLCARHGWLVGANSAKATLDKLGMSAVFGHTHHQRIHHKTLYHGPTPIGQIVGVEAGTLATVKGGLGYAANPDWQQGFASAHIWPDGTYSVELAQYDGKGLYWQGRRY